VFALQLHMKISLYRQWQQRWQQVDRDNVVKSEQIPLLLCPFSCKQARFRLDFFFYAFGDAQPARGRLILIILLPVTVVESE